MKAVVRDEPAETTRWSRARADADRHFIQLALELARNADPAPNPPVGALVVRQGRVVGAGYHQGPGEPHAEALALARAGGLSLGATLYVSLEPCNHHGRTPPCVDALREAGVKRVVFGCRDPNRLVRGGGAERLRSAGIEVVESELRIEAQRLIASWTATLVTAHH